MAKPVRPASEAYPSVCCPLNQSVSYSSEAGLVNEEDDQAPIFSISKSSMDVMATGPPHKRDPAWTRLDLRRSSSTNTHTEQSPPTLRPLHPNTPQQQHANSHQLSLTTQNMDLHSPPALSDRWMSNMERWSGCSGGGTQSRSSTPDTVVWKGGPSRPSSLTQVAPCSPDSPMSKLTSPPPTPSPLISPLHISPTPSIDPLTPSSTSTLTPTTYQPEDFPESSSPRSPAQTPASPPAHAASPEVEGLASAEDEGFLENHQLVFRFPSPVPSCDRLADAGESSHPRSLVDDVIEKLVITPRGTRLSDDEGVRGSLERLAYMTPESPAEGRESRGRPWLCQLELPWQPVPLARRSPLVTSLSDSGLAPCCSCHLSAGDGVVKVDAVREEATMTRQLETADAAVQTASPVGSWWNLRRNTSNSNMGSHSILGSPPGSRLNLKSSVGSNSNLVSPSSSMFPVSSGEEEEEEEEQEEKEARPGDHPAWDVASASSHDLDGRRSCLKMQAEEKDELMRRSSMKQVQWDEDGMTWDVHGASVDPEELSSAIRKHLDLHNTPRPLRPSSKKKRAPKPPISTDVLKTAAAATPSVTPSVTPSATPSQEDGGKEAAPEGEAQETEDTPEAPRRRSRAEAEALGDGDEEVYGGEAMAVCKSPSRASGHIRKKSVIRSLRRPAWCGGSGKTNQ